MASGDHDWTAGEVVTAANVDDYLMLQAKQEYATSAARDSALNTRKREGTLTHQADANSLTIYTGAAWSTIGPVHGPLTAFTPTWTNLTVGNGTLNTCNYQRIGRTVIYKVKFTFGSTTAVTGPITLSIPFAAQGDLIELECCSNVMYYDTSTTWRWVGFTAAVTSTTIKLTSMTTSTRRDLDTSASSPFAWATGDVIFLKIEYEAAGDA